MVDKRQIKCRYLAEEGRAFGFSRENMVITKYIKESVNFGAFGLNEIKYKIWVIGRNIKKNV